MYSGRTKEELMWDSKEELVMEEVKTSRRGGRMTNDRAEILMRLEKKGRNVGVRDDNCVTRCDNAGLHVTVHGCAVRSHQPQLVLHRLQGGDRL